MKRITRIIHYFASLVSFETENEFFSQEQSSNFAKFSKDDGYNRIKISKKLNFDKSQISNLSYRLKFRGCNFFQKRKFNF